MATYASVQGWEKQREMLQRFTNKKTYSKALEDSVKEATKLMILYAPRKTGRLEESIRYIKVSDSKYIIIVDVPYAQYMEYGTRYFPVGTINSPRRRISSSGKPSYHPFMRPAIWQTNRKHVNQIKRILFGTY